MKKYIVKIACLVISLLDKVIPKNNDIVVFNSFPDLSDNSFALFVHILEKYPHKKNVWLVKTLKNEKCQAIIAEFSNSNNFEIIGRDTFFGMYYYLRAKYVFFTHGIFSDAKIANKHCVVNLWHGMPLKTIGLLDNNPAIPNFKYGIANSSFYQTIMSQAFGIKKQNILITGQPRNDLMFQKNNCLEKLGYEHNSDKKIVLWTPTYRQSIVGDIRIDGNVSSDFPVVKSSQLIELDEFLETINTKIIVKLHPMDILNNNVFSQYRNIKIIKKGELESVNCQLYSLLGAVDILLTDFSSIYVDYLLLDRPIGFVLDDFSAYSKSRGFVFDKPGEYMPGQKIATFEQLKDFLYKTVVLNKDSFVNERQRVNKMLNNKFNNSSEELLTLIGFG